MNIALSARKFINNDINFNLSVILQTMNEMTDTVDFICFGESFLQGFDSLTWDYSIDKNIGISISSSEIKIICETAKEKKVAVSFGYIEAENNSLFSSYLVISKSGEIVYNFRRLSKGWKERSADFHYKEGTVSTLFEMEGVSFSIGLCGDLWDGFIVSQIANLKADLTIWPVYLDYTESEWNDVEKAEYAKQSALFNLIREVPHFLSGGWTCLYQQEYKLLLICRRCGNKVMSK